MKKITITFFATLILCTFFILKIENNDRIQRESKSKKMDKRTRADLAILHNYEMIKDPETGEVPKEELWKAVAYLEDMQNMKMKAAIPSVTWSERGPNNVGGRTRAIIFDPADPTHSRVFAASVSGGLWICNNIYASETRWTAVSDFFDNLAITTIAFHPVNTDTMYFGTGEGYFNADAVQGDGIWRSTNGGGSWTQLSSTTGSTFEYVQKIVVDSAGIVYAATRDGGIQKSTDHGSSWSKVLGSGASASSNRAADLEIAPDGDLFAAMGINQGDGIYRSADSGSTWTRTYTSSGEERIELACSPSNSNYVYGLTQNSSNNEVRYVIRSTNGGTSFSQLTPPNDGVSRDNFARNQAWYDLSIAVDPNDETTLYIGGIDLHKSTNSGGSWTQVSHWYGGGGFPEVHADQHIAVFAPESSDTMLFGHDGGIDLTKNASSSTPSFQHQVASYNVTQFYACAIHPDAGSNIFIGGTQDNGSHLFRDKGINATEEVTGGDGAFTHIDQNNPDYIFTSYVYNQYRRSTNGGSSFSSSGLNFSNSAGKFINPTDYDNDAQVMYCAHNSGRYLRWDNPRSGNTTAVITFSGSGTGEPSAIFCDPNTANRIYIGTDDGEVWKINNANGSPTATQITGGSMSGYVSCIDVEDGDADHILVTFSNYNRISVWESTNGGTTWTNVEGNLPNMPVRWGMFDPRNSDRAFLATELGVWSTDNLSGSTTNWAATNDGLANVRTDMLQWRASDSTLIAATHGRGMYTASLSQKVSADFTADKTAVYLGDPIEFQDVSTGATSWQWDLDNDGIIDATTKDITWQYTTPGYKTVKLIINGTDSITQTNYITVLPNLGIPYTTADGGDFESNGFHFYSEAISGNINLWELGSPSNHISSVSSGTQVWKTNLDADITRDDYTCALYSSSFNFTNSGTYTLSFDYRMEAAHPQVPLGVYVESSIDKSETWQKLGTYNSSNNWYSTSSNLIVSDGNCWSHTVNSYRTASVDVSSLSGNDDVRFRIVLKVDDGWLLNNDPNLGYQVDGFALDDFAISGPANDSVSFDIATSMKDSTERLLAANQKADFITSSNDILVSLENLDNHNYGETKVIIDNDGVGVMDFDTNTSDASKILQKTLRIIPTTNNTTGNYKVTLYFTEAEALAWKNATGNYYKNMTILKSPSSIGNGTVGNSVYGTNTVVDSTYNGNGLSICAEFSNGFSGFGAGLAGPAGPLPVDLISFTGQNRGLENILQWSTASELNSSHFEIEKFDKDHFISIDRVQSNGHSKIVRNYKYIDLNLEDNSNTYRLKMVDLDGSYEYSSVLTISNEDFFTNTVNIFPSPATHILNISRENQENNYSFTIMSMDTKVIETRENLTQDYTLDVSNMPEGTYFIAIRENGQIIKTKKVMIIH